MWQWFTYNALWILIITAVSLIVIAWALRRFRELLSARLPKNRQPGVETFFQITFWSILVIGVGFILTSIIAIIFSDKGVLAAVQPETVNEWILQHGLAILAIIILSHFLYWLSGVITPRIINQMATSRARRGKRAREELRKRAHTLSQVISSGVGILLTIIALLMVLSELEIDITPLLASAGVIGIALGFGAQSVTRDLFRGFFILIQDQYNKGDVITIAGLTGQVEEVTLWRTVLRDLDGLVHSIPNGEVTSSSNFTREYSRVNFNIPVAYGEDLDHVTEVINRVGEEMKADEYFGSLLLCAPYMLRVSSFGDSGIEMRVFAETKPLTQWDVKGELRRRLKKAFDEEGIEIPWPHIKLYYGQDKPESTTPKQRKTE